MNSSHSNTGRRVPALGLAAVASLTLLAAACGSDSKTAATQPAPVATQAPATTQAPMVTQPMSTEPMSTEPMSTEPMTTQPMSGSAMLQPSGPGCSAVPADGAGSFDGMAADPAATAASNNPVLSTLVTAVQKAGLVDTLNGPGPFTIFAPTNDAFAAIPADQLGAVLADQAKLTDILTYHVVAGQELSSADLIKAGTVTTVEGKTLTIGSDNGTLTVNGAKSVCMDVHTANATVHIISQVLLPA